MASVSHDGIRTAPALEVPDDELQEFLSVLPDSELVSLSGEGHVLALTDPEAMADHVARWVRRVGVPHDSLRAL